MSGWQICDVFSQRKIQERKKKNTFMLRFCKLYARWSNFIKYNEQCLIFTHNMLVHFNLNVIIKIENKQKKRRRKKLELMISFNYSNKFDIFVQCSYIPIKSDHLPYIKTTQPLIFINYVSTVVIDTRIPKRSRKKRNQSYASSIHTETSARNKKLYD